MKTLIVPACSAPSFFFKMAFSCVRYSVIKCKPTAVDCNLSSISEEKLYPHNWVFFNSHNQDERIGRFTKAFNRARDKSALPNMTPHTLRHYFISSCVMSGIKFFTIAKWVGHSNTKMIEQTYGHLSPEYRRKQMNMLNIVGTGSVESQVEIAQSGSNFPSQSPGTPTKTPTGPVFEGIRAKKK